MRVVALVCALGWLALIGGVPVPGRVKLLRGVPLVMEQIKQQVETINVHIQERLDKIKPPNIIFVVGGADTPIRGLGSVVERLGGFLRLLRLLPEVPLMERVYTLRTHLQLQAERMRCAEGEGSGGAEPLLEEVRLHPFTGRMVTLERLQTYLTSLLTHLERLDRC